MTCALSIVRQTTAAELRLLSLAPLSFGGEAAPNVSGPLAEKLPETSRNHPRVLVVDDAPDVTEMIGLLLRYAGYEVVTVFSGPEAYEAAQRGMFDVVVSDIGMPGMSGWELARAVREINRTVPLAVVTGWGEAVGSAEQRAAQVDWVITKPFSAERIAELAREMSRRKASAGGVAPAYAAEGTVQLSV